MRPTPSEALSGREALVADIAFRHGSTRTRVFGSVARGRDSLTSDLDLLIDLPFGTSFFALDAMEEEISDLLGVDVDVVPVRDATPEMLDSAIDLTGPSLPVAS